MSYKHGILCDSPWICRATVTWQPLVRWLLSASQYPSLLRCRLNIVVANSGSSGVKGLPHYSRPTPNSPDIQLAIPRHHIRLTTPTSRHHHRVANQSSRCCATSRRWQHFKEAWLQLVVSGTTQRGQPVSAAWSASRRRPAGHRPVLNIVVATTRDSSVRHASSRCQYQSIQRQIPSRSSVTTDLRLCKCVGYMGANNGNEQQESL